MALRLVFTREDLQHIRFASGSDPLWELVFSLFMARAAEVPARFTAWRKEIRHQRSSGLGLLYALVADSDCFPDFLTPYPPAGGPRHGVRSPRLHPTAPLGRRPLSGVPAPRAGPGPGARDGRRASIGRLVTAVREAPTVLVAPHWDHVEATTSGERAARTRELGTLGVGAVLTGLPGVLGWNGETLLVRYPQDRTVHLAGRGLTLVPAAFCWGSPVTWINPGLPRVLAYQAWGADRPASPRPAFDHLVRLLGRTRAECLHHLSTAHTTSDLAARLATSVGTASKQTTALREAGLVTSRRRGAAVFHRVTPLGSALLSGNTNVW
ncbi:MAG TPA: winged helix-turn-helix domain-containing protein [Amycolatopsis sp.]|nr:winged helix-turn-helix domain-containing protein [Amycolatopsis sp.]